MKNLMIGCAVATLVALSARSEARPPEVFPVVKQRAVVPLAHEQLGLASWYGEELQGCNTASGEAYDPRGLTAASPDLPLGCKVLVTNLTNKKSLVVRINDRGPVTRGRFLDLSKAAALRLGFVGAGTALVKMRTIHYPKGYIVTGHHRLTRLSACLAGVK